MPATATDRDPATVPHTRPITGVFVAHAGPSLVNVMSASQDLQRFASEFSGVPRFAERYRIERVRHALQRIIADKESESMAEERARWLRYAQQKGLPDDTLHLTPEQVVAALDAGVVPTSQADVDAADVAKERELSRYLAMRGEFDAFLRKAGTCDFETGAPVTIRAFHGSNTGVIADEGFDAEQLGTNTGAASARMGFFFSGQPHTANAYVDEAKDRLWDRLSSREQDALLDDVVESFGAIEPVSRATGRRYRFQERTYASEWEARDARREMAQTWLIENPVALADAFFDLYEKEPPGDIAPAVYPVRLHMQNPAVHDYRGETYREESYAEVISRAKAAGHDGVILMNTYDGGPVDNVYVVFDAAAIEMGAGLVVPDRPAPSSRSPRP